MATQTDDKSEETLAAMFSKGLALHSELENATERTDSTEYQVKQKLEKISKFFF